MRKTMLLVFMSALVLTACSQNLTPPREVQDAFAKKFTQVKNLKWDQEDNEWEAEFILDGKETSASFDNAGTWLETESEMKKKDLPADIFKAVNLKFDGWEMEEIESIEKPDFKGYEIVMEKEDTETEILVSEAGEITIKKVKVEDDEDDDGDEDGD